MLKSWSIQNFKPILDSGELKLAPVTVLAGRNSSGKSSLIQSILMIAQTLSSRVLDRALLPNGPIVQLGTFEDILSEQTGLRTLMVRFELKMEKEELKAPANARIRLVDGRAVAGLSTNIKSVKITSQFRSASSNGASASAIEASKVNVENVSLEVIAFPSYKQLNLFVENEIEPLLEFSIDIKSLTPNELDEFLKDVSPEYLRLVPYTPKESNYQGTFKLKSKLPSTGILNPSLIAFSHFLPTRLIGKYIIEERRKLRLIQALDLALEYPNETLGIFSNLSDFFDPDVLISQTLKDGVLDLCKDEDISEAFSGQTLLDLIRWYRSLKLGRKKRFAASSELDDVGAKGEYAAAVYDANQNARIRWYNPLNEKIEGTTLKVALDAWVSYLGVANEVKIQMAGQSGVSWQVVQMKGHKALPLTAVGVGVSQILPILVMGLLAP